MSTRVSTRKAGRKKPAPPARRSPVQRRSAETVEAVLQATAPILSRGGLEALSTNAVAARAGVSIGSVYQYFPDKQALVDALMARYVARQQELIVAAVVGTAGKPLVEGVTAFVRGLISAHRVDPRMGQIFHQLLPVLPTSPIDAFERELERTVAGLFAGVAELRPRDAEMAAIVLVRATGGVIRTTMRRSPELVLTDGFERELVALLLGYLEGMRA